MLATASFDASTAVWAERGGDWECVAVVEGHENEVKSCAWSPSGALLATCGRDKTVWIWEVQPGFDFECVAVLHGHTQDVKQVRWHPTEDVLVSVSYDDEIRVWEEDSGGDDWSCARVLTEKEGGHGSTVWSAAFEACGHGSEAHRGDRRMATCSDDRRIVVWDAKGALRQTARGSPSLLLSHEFFSFPGRDARALVRRSSRARSRCARVNIPASEIEPWAWQLRRAKLQPRRHLLVDVSDLRPRHRDDREDVFPVSVFPGSALSRDARAVPLDARSPLLSFSPTPRRGLRRNAPKKKKTAGAPGLALAATAAFACGHDRPVLALSWGPAGLLAAGGGDNSVRCYGVAGGNEWGEVGAAAKAHAEDVNSVAWHPTKPNVLASCSDDGSVKIWNVAPAGNEALR